jgi:hypothetical protein
VKRKPKLPCGYGTRDVNRWNVELRYLADTRRIDLAALPANIDAVLRFHSCCVFGPGTRHPCLLALMRNPCTDAITGIHRIALSSSAQKIERRMLGRTGVVKLWPPGPQLVVAEGLETTLAGATRIEYRSAPLRPAWAALAAIPLGQFPLIPGVERLIVLVDDDPERKTAAARCSERWTSAGRTVVYLTPKQRGFDFNDTSFSVHEHVREHVHGANLHALFRRRWGDKQ